MSKKPKARGSPRKTKKASGEKTQRERFIETARALGVDESGSDFERAIKKILPERNGKIVR